GGEFTVRRRNRQFCKASRRTIARMAPAGPCASWRIGPATRPAARAHRADRLDRRSTLGRHQHAVPAHPTRARIPETRDHPPAHGPGEPAAQPREDIVALDRKALHRGAQLTQQLLEPRLLGAQPLEILRPRVGLRLEAREHVAALDARELQLVQLCALLPLELGELLILGIELPLEFGNALDVLLDEPDLRGARAAEVAVVGEDAAGER